MVLKYCESSRNRKTDTTVAQTSITMARKLMSICCLVSMRTQVANIRKGEDSFFNLAEVSSQDSSSSILTRREADKVKSISAAAITENRVGNIFYW